MYYVNKFPLLSVSLTRIYFIQDIRFFWGIQAQGCNVQSVVHLNTKMFKMSKLALNNK